MSNMPGQVPPPWLWLLTDWPPGAPRRHRHSTCADHTATTVGSCASSISAQVAARFCPTSKTFHDRKRNEGKSHKQAILVLARPRLDVLWALIRDHRTFTTEPPHPSLTSAWRAHAPVRFM
ncbi:hypothetical protein [Streptomyces sp. NPDC054952]